MEILSPRHRPAAARLLIVTPAAPGSLHGNRMTALRWQRQLRVLGHPVSIANDWNGQPAGVLVALHALRSHDAVLKFRAAHPDRPIVLVLTGTDLYRDLAGGACRRDRAIATMHAADRLVVLQDEAAAAVPGELRSKLVTIFQSVAPLERQPTSAHRFLVTLIGHLREEKDPFCIVRALRRLPEATALHVLHLGQAMDEAHQRDAECAMQQDARYAWLGELPHRAALRWLASSDLMVISSRMEGGAHVVSEAIAAGVPVLASDIAGNRGLLGADYPGYFPVGDDAALAALLARAMAEPDFLALLTNAVLARRPLVSPDTERAAIAALLDSLA